MSTVEEKIPEAESPLKEEDAYILPTPSRSSGTKPVSIQQEELAVSVLEFLVHPKATRDIVLTDSDKETKKRKKSTVESNDSNGEDVASPEKENGRNEDTETEDEKDKAGDKKSTDKKSSLKRTTEKEKPAPEEEKSLKGSTSSSKKQKVDKDDSSKEKSKKQKQAKGSKDQGKNSKKGKREPTTKEMHVVVAKILKEVDFNTATLSDFLQKLGNHFGVDLMHRKTEVRDIITDAINEMSGDDDDFDGEENTEDEAEIYKDDGLTMCLNIG